MSDPNIREWNKDVESFKNLDWNDEMSKLEFFFSENKPIEISESNLNIVGKAVETKYGSETGNMFQFFEDKTLSLNISSVSWHGRDCDWSNSRTWKGNINYEITTNPDSNENISQIKSIRIFGSLSVKFETTC